MKRALAADTHRQKRVFTLGSFLLVILFLLPATGQPATAAGNIRLVDHDIEYGFAQRIQFNASFTADSAIAGITLLLAAKNDTHVFSAGLPIASGQTAVSTDFVLDLTEYPLRPFAQIDYWWQVEASDGSWLETEHFSFVYTDNRYDWHETPPDLIRVYWAADDPALGHTALRIAQDGLERMLLLLPTPISDPITIYIYPSQSELRSALRLAGSDWVGGHADPEWGVILVSAGASPTASIDLQQTIPHEVAHLVIYRNAGGEHRLVPRWLHEGLAIGNELSPDPALTLLLEEALASDTLVPFATLCVSFPTNEEAALLAYAQSASMVRYLKNYYGNHLIGELIAAYGDGADCSGGLERVLGVSLDSLQSDWKASLTGEPTRPSDSDANTSEFKLWVGFFFGSLAIAGAFLVLRPRPVKMD